MLTETQYDFLRELKKEVNRSRKAVNPESFIKKYGQDFIDDASRRGLIMKTKRGIRVTGLGKIEIDCYATEFLI